MNYKDLESKVYNYFSMAIYMLSNLITLCDTSPSKCNRFRETVAVSCPHFVQGAVHSPVIMECLVYGHSIML